MSDQIISLRLIALAAPLLLLGVGIGVPASTARAADCLGAPTSGPPAGSHWYYRTDRAKGRKCWFLRALSPPTQDKAAQDAPATHAGAVKKPATASVGAHTATSTGNNVPPVPPPKPQTASASSASTHEPVRQPTQEENAAPPIPEAPTPQPSASRQTNAQEPVTTPAAPIVWPDPPAVATVTAQKPSLVPRNALPYSIPSTVGARPADDPEGVVQIRTRSNEAAETTAASAGTLIKISLAVALGLTVASLLYRLLAKISAVRDRRIVMDHAGLDWVHDDRQEHQFHVERQQRGLVNEREKFVDDFRLSLVPTAGDYGVRRPHQIEPKSDDLRESRASHIADELRERENRCMQLLRDLNQMM